MAKSHAEHWLERVAEMAFRLRQQETRRNRDWKKVSECTRADWREKARIIMKALDILE